MRNVNFGSWYERANRSANTLEGGRSEQLCAVNINADGERLYEEQRTTASVNHFIPHIESGVEHDGDEASNLVI